MASASAGVSSSAPWSPATRSLGTAADTAAVAPLSPAALGSTVKAAFVDYMRFHGYSRTLQAFNAESAHHPPVEGVLLGACLRRRPPLSSGVGGCV